MIFSEYMPSSGIAKNYKNDSSIPSFLRNLNTIFHSGYINLHSPEQYKNVPFSLHPLQHLLFVGFLMMDILTDVRWYFTVVVMSFSNNKWCWVFFFMCLLAIYISSLEKCLFRSSTHFFIGLFVFLMLSCMSCSHCLEIDPL